MPDLSDLKIITYEEIRRNTEIKEYIEQGNAALGVLGFTEHSYPHVCRTAGISSYILKELNFDARTCELAAIAGYMHDIGNVVNRIDHAQSGAIMAFDILRRLGMMPEDIALIVSAIGNHDESTAAAVNPVAAALILADKSDVRRSRVRNIDKNPYDFNYDNDIHDRVNYAVEKTSLIYNEDKTAIILSLNIDTDICPVMDYFEIFLGRMSLCRRAAEYLGIHFEIKINELRLL